MSNHQNQTPGVRAAARPCPSCHKPILWAITEASGRRQPLNLEPDERGSVACYTDHTGTLRSRALTKERPDLEHVEWRAMPHMATCSGPKPRIPAGGRGKPGPKGVLPRPWIVR